VVEATAVSGEAALSPESLSVSSEAPPAVASPVEAPKVSLHTDTETLLESVKPLPSEVKGESAEALEGKKTAEPPLPEPLEPSKPITYSDFILPEGMVLSGKQLETASSTFAKHGLSQEAAQELLDTHVAALQSYAESSFANQHKAFSDMRKGWRDQVLADEQLGGSGHQTAMKAVARARDMLVPDTERPVFDEFLRVTGAGDHPVFLRLLHAASRRLAEPAPLAVAPRPAPISAPRRDVLYDHPNSKRIGG
jgi:hypothetical protein